MHPACTSGCICIKIRVICYKKRNGICHSVFCYLDEESGLLNPKRGCFAATQCGVSGVRWTAEKQNNGRRSVPQEQQPAPRPEVRILSPAVSLSKRSCLQERFCLSALPAFLSVIKCLRAVTLFPFLRLIYERQVSAWTISNPSIKSTIPVFSLTF